MLLNYQDSIIFFFFQKVNELACSLYASGTNLSRSASSVGEHQSVTYVSPTLPKRAETFGGFDNSLSSPKSKYIVSI
jgi:A-kinase anchor protein 13